MAVPSTDRLQSITDDPGLSALLMSGHFWRIVGPQRVSMRGLYISSRAPGLWDRLLLKIRAAFRRTSERS